MMANSWKTVPEICADYGIKDKTFYAWADECRTYPEYRDAIICPTGKRTFIDEDKWQAFLRFMSEKRRKKLLDPHLREENNNETN